MLALGVYLTSTFLYILMENLMENNNNIAISFEV